MGPTNDKKPQSDLSNAGYHLTAAQMVRIISAGESPRDRLLIRLLAETGLRRGEAANLNVEDVRLSERLVLIRRGKGMKSRLVPVTPSLARDLALMISKIGDGPLFGSRRRGRISLRQINRIVAEAGRRAGIDNPNPKYDNITPHLFRHSFARLWKVSGGGIETLARIMGHSSVSTTWDLYGKEGIEDIRQNYSRIMKKLRPETAGDRTGEAGFGKDDRTDFEKRDRAKPAKRKTPTPVSELGKAGRKKKLLDMYLEEIGAIPLLTTDEEGELARRIRKDEEDKEARDMLVSANARFAVYIARSYCDCGLPLLDLIQAGNVGLIKAAKRFDPGMGFRFVSYAVWWIFQSIEDLIHRQSRIVRFPLSRAKTVIKVGRAWSALGQELGREPTLREVAAAMEGVPGERVEEALKLLLPAVSLDASADGADNPGLAGVLESSLLSPEENTLTGLLRSRIHDGWDDLTENLTQREKETIDLRFHLGHIFVEEDPLTLEQVGRRFCLTRERIRQIEEKAIRKIRTSLLNSLPPEERAILAAQIQRDKQRRRAESDYTRRLSGDLPPEAVVELDDSDAITVPAGLPPKEACSRLSPEEMERIFLLAEKVRGKAGYFDPADWRLFAGYYGLDEQPPKKLHQLGKEIGRHPSFVASAKYSVLGRLAGREKRNIDALKRILDLYRCIRLRNGGIRASVD